MTYAEGLLKATPPEQLAEHHRPPRIKPAVTPEQMARLEREMGKAQGQYRQAEQTYGADLLHLIVAKGYLTKLLANEAVRRHLNHHQPEILNEFGTLVDTVALDPGALGMADEVAEEVEDEEEYEGENSVNSDRPLRQTADVVTLAATA